MRKVIIFLFFILMIGCNPQKKYDNGLKYTDLVIGFEFDIKKHEKINGCEVFLVRANSDYTIYGVVDNRVGCPSFLEFKINRDKKIVEIWASNKLKEL